MEKAARRLPFGRLIDPEEAARDANFLVSDDAGLRTGAIVNFDQSAWAGRRERHRSRMVRCNGHIDGQDPQRRSDEVSVGVGVIGTGVMGSEHTRLLRRDAPGAHLAGVFDSDAARAQAAAAGSAVFSDPRSLIASDRIEAVIIASPDATHAELTLACLEAGKPVLCEKPLASTAAEALRVVQAEVALNRRLIQVGYMRRFDPGYQEIKRIKDEGGVGATVLLHNVHRNVRAPEWFTGAMAVTNSFVHEIDISRWLTGSEMVSAHVSAGRGGDPLMIVMRTDRDEIVSTEVFMNAAYGYHVHAELVGRSGTVALAPPSITLWNKDRAGGLSYPENWVPRFADAYRRQLVDWAGAVKTGVPVGASAWDGYVASAIAEQIAAGLTEAREAALKYAPRPRLYD
jgi:myo-inositol 2-dehydrogenase / D-chiro-inositol 1-dehydrogenase